MRLLPGVYPIIAPVRGRQRNVYLAIGHAGALLAVAFGGPPLDDGTEVTRWPDALAISRLAEVVAADEPGLGAPSPRVWPRWELAV